MAGRKPKLTAVKELEGNPGKRKLNSKEPVPAKGMPFRVICRCWTRYRPHREKHFEMLSVIKKTIKNIWKNQI